MNHTETLKTGYSTNVQQELLIYADEQSINQNFKTKVHPQQLKGWTQDVHHTFVEEVGNVNGPNRKRILRPSTRANSFNKRGEERSQKTKEELKQNLLYYLRHKCQQTAVSINQEQYNEKTRTIVNEKYDFVKGEKLKGIERSNKFKSFSISKKTIKNNVSEYRTQKDFKTRTIDGQKSKCQSVSKKVGVTCYPLEIDFAEDLQDKRLKYKLNFYLRKCTKKYSQ